MENKLIVDRLLRFVLFFHFIVTPLCYAQAYKINAEDILRIIFFDKPEFNRETPVGLDGNISLPVVESIKASGFTTQELSQRIISEFSIYTVSLIQVSAEVIKYENNNVFVTGNITKPGKYAFEKIPNIWSVISEAGGPKETANLSNVLIIRRSEKGSATIPVNLKKIIKIGDLSRLPKLQPGDNIHIPAVLSEDRNQSLESAQQQRSEIYIYGEINSPAN
jgi:polysaccharide biosynthesis/export protein